MPILTAMPSFRLPIALLVACSSLLAPATAFADLAPPEQQDLTVNIGRFPTTLDPSKVATEADFAVQNALFAPLYRSPGGTNGKLVPFLASSQPVITNGGRTYTISLRAARWSDGVAVTAGDVRLAYTRGRASYMGGFFGAVQSVTAPSARTVRITLARPVPWFDQLLATNVLTPVPSHTIRRYGAKWTVVRNLVTSGPFRVDSTRGASELVLSPNPRWWGVRTVRLKTLTMLALPPASASTLFDAKRLDATLRDTSILRSQLPRRRTDARFRTVASGGGQYLYLNTRTPELASAPVRRGIALAIDRAALTQLTSYGIDQPLETIVPAGIRGFATVAPAGGTLLSSTGAAEPTRAREELATGAWNPVTTFDLYYPTVDISGTIAMKIEANLEAVGVKVELHPTAPADFAKPGLAISPVRADVDAVLQGWQADYSDPQDFHMLFTCAGIDAGLNASNHCSDTWDPAYAAATDTFAPFASRLVSHRALEEQLTGPSGTMPAVPLYEAMGEYLVQPWVRGYIHHPSGRVDFERTWITVP